MQKWSAMQAACMVQVGSKQSKRWLQNAPVWLQHCHHVPIDAEEAKEKDEHASHYSSQTEGHQHGRRGCQEGTICQYRIKEGI